MDKDREIDRKIRESAENLNAQAPNNLWDKFSHKLDNTHINTQIDNKVKRSAESLEDNAPPEIWGEINKQLEIDSIWLRISKELDRIRALKWIRNAVALLLLFLLSWVGFDSLKWSEGQRTEVAKSEKFNPSTIDQDSKNFDFSTPSSSDSETEKPENNIKSKSGSTFENSIISKSNKDSEGYSTEKLGAMSSVNKRIDQNYSELSKNANEFIAENKIVATNENVDVIIPDGSIAKISPLNFEAGFNLDDEPILNQSKSYEGIQEEQFPEIKENKLFVGLSFHYNNTWILNEEVRRSFEENSTNGSSRTYSPSYGLVAKYSPHKNHNVFGEILLRSSLEQDYSGYSSEGNYYKKKLKINYFKIKLGYQLDAFHRKGKHNSHLSIRLGGFAGLLNDSQEYYNDVTISTDNRYNRYDYGINFALGQEREWNGLLIGYGFATEYGFTNIFSGNDEIRKDFNVTNTMSFGPYLNLMYKF